MKNNDLKLLSEKKKREITAGGPVLGIVITTTLVISIVLQIVELILNAILTPTKENENNHYYDSNHYYNKNIFTKIHSYSSINTLVTGL